MTKKTETSKTTAGSKGSKTRNTARPANKSNATKTPRPIHEPTVDTQPTPVASATNKADKATATKEKKSTGGTRNKKIDHVKHVRSSSYHVYIKRVARRCTAPNKRQISRDGLEVFNDMLSDVYTSIVQQAARMMGVSKTQTMKARDVEAAVLMVLTGELAKRACLMSKEKNAVYKQSLVKGVVESK